MNRFSQIFLAFAISFSGFSQDQIINELKEAYERHEYDKIIAEHSDKLNEYPAKAIYYVAMAYYMIEDDNNAIKTMDLSIEKDKADSDAHFIKGMTLNYMNLFDKAIESFNKAIEIDSTNSNFYSGLGDSYFSKKEYEKALIAYVSATQKKEPIDRPFTMIPQIYAELNQPNKALEAFYASREIISKDSDSYIITLYNIGLYEFLNRNYDKSEVAYKELISLAPNDFNAYTKLIQVFYGKKDYEKAEPLKEKLYTASEAGVLPDYLKDQFCFDQFYWKDKLIFVFERFAVKEKALYYKHIFYIPNEKGETEFTIQTENSPISVEMGGPKYVVGMDKGSIHQTFTFIDENFSYDDLKEIVIRILEEQARPISSSRKASNGN